MSELKWLRNPAVLEAHRDEGWVLFNPDNGFFCGLDTVGSEVWGELEDRMSTAELVATFIRRFKVDAATCERDVRAFLEKIAAKGFVTEQA